MILYCCDMLHPESWMELFNSEYLRYYRYYPESTPFLHCIRTEVLLWLRFRR